MLEHKYSYHCPHNTPIYCVYTAKTAYKHHHIDFYEFCIFASGSYLHIFQDEESYCSTSHLLFFKPGSSHELLINKPGSEHYSLIVREDYFEEYFRRYCETHKTYNSTTDLPTSISKILSGSQSSYLSKLASILAYNVSQERFAIAEHLLDTLLFTCLESLPMSCNVGIDAYVNDLMLTFDSYSQLDVDIEELCYKYPASQRTILDRFKILTGSTIVEYRNKRRLEYAAHLLQKENYSITTISNMIGISCLSYFAKQFKAHFGVSPKQYQSLYQKKKR